MNRWRALFAAVTLTACWTGAAFAQAAEPADVPAQTPSTMAAPPAIPPEAAKVHWYDNLKYEAFVDTYFSQNWNFTKPQSPIAPLALTGGNQFRAYDASNGFALHWFGLDVSHAPDPVGGGVNLRFGPGAYLFNAFTSSPDTQPATGLQYIKNAYVNWKPGGKDAPLTLTMGKFNQPFGSEVPESQYNMNYSRSLLYWYAQPLFLTGFKVDYTFSEALTGTLFLLNGWNTSQDGNRGKTGAIQLSYMPASQLMAVLGYAIGPEQPDVSVSTDPATGATVLQSDGDADSRLRHFVDLIVDIKPTKELRLLANADYGREKPPPAANQDKYEWYGANLAIGYTFADTFAASVRGEWYRDPQGFTTTTGKDTTLYDGTLTLTATPTPNLILKLDNRVDIANEAFFQKRTYDTSKTQFTTTLGVVATTGM